MATLYVVGTPIGNLEDITLRAIRILKEVDCILCEDTRMTKRLLARHSIATPTLSYHMHSGALKVERIIEMLESGKNLALVTDAGTPGISDPGSQLVAKLRETFGSDELSIVSVPGPSAVAAVLSIAGFPSSDFLFLGFLPHKKGRETLFKEIAAGERTVVFYESPHRVIKTLTSLKEFLPPSKKVGIGRELTKIHEEFISGSPEDLLHYFAQNPEKERGEFVILVG